MLGFHSTRKVVRLAECAGPRDCPQVVTPTLRGCSASLAVPAVEVAVTQTSEAVSVRVKGKATVKSAGALVDGLLGLAARRPAVVTLDLSELRSISCLAMGGLVAYCRGVVRAGGRVCLADELQPAVREALTRARLFDLFETTAEAGPADNARRLGPASTAFKQPRSGLEDLTTNTKGK
jgi:anti-anti-sigma factor